MGTSLSELPSIISNFLIEKLTRSFHSPSPNASQVPIQTSEPSDSRMEGHPSGLYRQIRNPTMVGLWTLVDGLPHPGHRDGPTRTVSSVHSPPLCVAPRTRTSGAGAQSILVFMIRFSR